MALAILAFLAGNEQKSAVMNKCTFLRPLAVNNGQQRSAATTDDDDDLTTTYSFRSSYFNGSRVGYRRHASASNLIVLTTLFLLALIGKHISLHFTDSHQSQ